MILDKFKLDNKVAIITGASRGLGQGMAIALAEAGANVVGVGVSDSSETGKIIEKLGRQYHQVTADLSHSESADDIIQQSIDRFGKIDILVNNAGIIRRNDFVKAAARLLILPQCCLIKAGFACRLTRRANRRLKA